MKHASPTVASPLETTALRAASESGTGRTQDISPKLSDSSDHLPRPHLSPLPLSAPEALCGYLGRPHAGPPLNDAQGRAPGYRRPRRRGGNPSVPDGVTNGGRIRYKTTSTLPKQYKDLITTSELEKDIKE